MGKFKGTEGEFVTAATAGLLQTTYLKGKRCTGNPDPIRGEFFGIEQIKKLFGKTGCKGIRIYHGEDEKGEPKLILVAVDENANKLVKDKTGLKGDGDDDHLANGPKCPQECGQ